MLEELEGGAISYDRRVQFGVCSRKDFLTTVLYSTQALLY
jgi:hypothetical protein